MNSIATLKPIHPFPARMAPNIVWNRLRRMSPQLTVLDPMAGSGTSAVAAQRLGHRAIGYDSDPLAVVIARAWCCRTTEGEFREAANSVLSEAEKRVKTIADKDAYPSPDDSETRLFAEFWFDLQTRRQLAALAAPIRVIKSEKLRSLMWCAFSRMIITKEKGVSLAMDVSHSRPHRVYTVSPVSPFKLFPKAIALIAKNKFSEPSDCETPEAEIECGDARNLPIKAETVDIVITSPPYLNAIDYLRGHRLSLIWMGYTIPFLRQLRASNVGTEHGLDLRDTTAHELVRDAIRRLRNEAHFASRERGMIAKYVHDMNCAVQEVARVLKPGGRAIYVVGDSTLRGNFIENSAIVKFLAQSRGLRWISTQRREIPANRRYLPPPKSPKSDKQLSARMGEEVILCFAK